MAAGDLTTLANVKEYLGLLPSWAQSTSYSVGDNVRANNAQYIATVAGTSASTGAGPSGTSSAITDHTVTWKYVVAQTAGDDALLSHLISAVSSAFSKYCDRTFASTDYGGSDANDPPALMVSGKGGTAQPLPEYPVTAVSAVTVDATTVPARSVVGSSGYVIDNDVLCLDGGYRFCRGIKNISITYTAGYSSIPDDLAQACIECCASWYRRRARIDEKSKSVQGEVISYSTAEFPDAAKATINRYVRRWPR